MNLRSAKLFVLPLIFIFVSAEVYAAASNAMICRRQGGTWNQWSQKCTKSYKRSYKKNKYKYNKYKKKSYSNYGSKSRYNSNSRYKYKKKKSYSNYGSSSYGNSSRSKYKNSRSVSSIKKKALTYCWQNKKRTKWTCDGPTQKLITFWKTKSKARSLAGCKSYSRERNFRSGVLFECTRKLESYDRDIRGKYGISRNY